MKIFKLPKLAESAPDGSFCLGSPGLDSDAVYLLYSRLRPGDAPKKLAAAEGTEEIVFVMKGNIRVKCARMDFIIGPGEAFHSKECASFHIENIGSEDAVFITAGGRGGPKARQAEKAPEIHAAEPEEAEETVEEDEFVITREDEP